MTKPYDCEECPDFDKWLEICEDDYWINSKSGRLCCKYEEGAILGELWDELNKNLPEDNGIEYSDGPWADGWGERGGKI